MALRYILSRFSQKTGLDITEPDDRQFCLDIINEGARELYDEKDYVGCLEEIVVPCSRNTCIALPAYVGNLRAIREATIQEPWRLSTMRPRYHYKSWNQDAYRNWRDKTISPLAVDLDNNAPPVLVVPYVESPPVVVTLTGPTDNSHSVSETVIMDSLTKQAVTPFLDYTSITKDRISTYDVIIQDADLNEISVIYNNATKAEYRIMDVASYPFTSTTVGSEHFLMEALYKKRLYPLTNDEDEFPVSDFDDIIINKAVQLRYEDTGNVDKAMLADKKASRTAARRSTSQVGGYDLRADVQPTGYDTAFSRMRRRAYR